MPRFSVKYLLYLITLLTTYYVLISEQAKGHVTKVGLMWYGVMVALILGRAFYDAKKIMRDQATREKTPD